MQEVQGRLGAVRAALQGAQEGFAATVAYFGENAAAFAYDGDFWGDVTAFVHAFSAAQLALQRQQQARMRVILIRG